MRFDFSGFKPNLFSLKAKEDVEQNKQAPIKQDSLAYDTYGFRQAGSMNGSIEGLKICLNRVFQEHMGELRRNANKQEELRKPFKEKLGDIGHSKDKCQEDVKVWENEIIPNRKKRIEELKKEISDVKQFPEQYTESNVGKPGFYIGLFILVLLTIYLFVFYSSASYSALFKEFRISDAQNGDSILTKSIFDAKAIPNAWLDGVTELILILTIPSVFIGLGYLIHKFQESKSWLKYLKIAALLVITFIFDSILAFEITKKIYDLQANNSFSDLPEYDLNLAFKRVNFWLIIFAGFVVYIIWGFVFDFIMEAHSKLDMIKVRIKNLRDHIQRVQQEIDEIENNVNSTRLKIAELESEMTKLKNIINGTIIHPREVREALSQFMVGWYNWLSHGREYSRSEHNNVYNDFIAQNIAIIEETISEK